MNVAVGRLQLSVTVARPAAQDPTIQPGDPRPTRAERAFRKHQQMREVEADRLRWETRYRCSR